MRPFKMIDLRVEVPEIVSQFQSQNIEIDRRITTGECRGFDIELLQFIKKRNLEAIEIYQAKGRNAGLMFMHESCREQDRLGHLLEIKNIMGGYADGLRS